MTGLPFAVEIHRAHEEDPHHHPVHHVQRGQVHRRLQQGVSPLPVPHPCQLGAFLRVSPRIPPPSPRPSVCLSCTPLPGSHGTASLPQCGLHWPLSSSQAFNAVMRLVRPAHLQAPRLGPGGQRGLNVNILLHQLLWSGVETPNLKQTGLSATLDPLPPREQTRKWHLADTLGWDKKVVLVTGCPQGAQELQSRFPRRTSSRSMRSGTFPVRPRTQRTCVPLPTSLRTCRPATTTATFSARWTW